jgi:gamma-glutamyltranspeptidase/glutathione hydrolase
VGRLGRALPPGAAVRARPFRNPQLAATWKRLLDEARGGSREEEIERARSVFYEGFVAEEIDRFAARGRRLLLSGDDLRVVARDARAAGRRSTTAA